MHCQLLVAIAGTVKPDDVDAALAQTVNAYAEQDDALEPGHGEWDWWVVGGHWRGSFSLTPEALARKQAGILVSPIDADCHIGGFLERQLRHYEALAEIRSLFSVAEHGDLFSIAEHGDSFEPTMPHQSDCARLRDVELDSLAMPLFWIDLEQRLHTIDERAMQLSDVLNGRFAEWIATLPNDSWLIAVDVHR